MNKESQLQLTGGNFTKSRRELDYYPTPAQVTVALLNHLQLSPRRVWEPAAGDGAMVEVLRRYGHEVIATDIRTGTDYLTAKPPIGIQAIITNPPFNQSGEFIAKAIREVDLVAMLLKSQYWHARKRLDLFRTQPPAFICPLTWRPDFLDGERGGAPTMEVLWTVWIRGDNNARYCPLERPVIEEVKSEGK